MIAFACTLLCVVSVAGLGLGFVQLLGMNLKTLESWGLSVVTGVVLTSWLSFYASLAGLPLGSQLSWGISLLGIGCLLIGLGRLRNQQAPNTPKANSSKLARLCLWGIAGLIILAFMQTLLTPQRFWDERAIFAIKSRILFSSGTIWTPVLHDPNFVQYHPKYPLLIPLAEQHVYSLIGEDNDRWSKVIFPMLYAGMVLTFVGVCLRRFSSGWSWLCGLFVATIPVLMPYEYGFLSAQGDAVMACLHGLGVIFLWDAMRTADRRELTRNLILAGVLIASAAFTKEEGIAFFAVDFIAWCLALCFGVTHSQSSELSAQSRWKFCSAQGLTWTVCSVLIFLPWMLYRRHLPSTGEMQYIERLSYDLLLQRINTLSWSVPHLLSRMFVEWKLWGLQWWLALAAVVSSPRRAIAPSQLFLILNLLGTLAALFVAGMVAPAELEEHIGGSSHRYLMQISPVAILLATSQGAPDRQTKTSL